MSDFKVLENYPISLNKAVTVNCVNLEADNISFDDVKADDLVCNSVESKVYTQDGVTGLFVKSKNGEDVLHVGVESAENVNDPLVTGVFMGRKAGKNIVDSLDCTAVGADALEIPPGYQNTAFGSRALKGVFGAVASTSVKNTCVGGSSGESIEGNSFSNTCVGFESGQVLNNCNSCTFIGESAGVNAGQSVTNSVCVGRFSKTSQSNTICVGNLAIANSPGECIIGSSAITSISNGGSTTCDLGSTTHEYKDIYAVGDLKVGTIQGNTPSGGMWANTAQGVLIDEVKVGSTTLFTAGQGSLIIPANSIKVGDSFHSVVAGNIYNGDGIDTVTITVLYGIHTVATVVLDMENGMVDSSFEVEVDTTFRAVGANGICVTNIDFTYNKKTTKDWMGTREISVTNSVNTTVPLQHDVRAQVIGLGGTQIQSELGFVCQEY